MEFDIKKLKEINELDFEQVAIWPKEIKIVVAFICAAIVAGICYYAIISSKLPLLADAKDKEVELRQTFEAKYRVAVNLRAYQEQLDKMERDFSSMLKSLPTSNETPGLLDDVTFVGTDAGLSFKLLNWQKEIPKEFYTELPIQIEVMGSYHEFGQFTSNVANLPHIVTLHDFEIDNREGQLVMRLQAKTYRAETTGVKKKKKSIVTLSLVTLLSACGADIDDLVAYTEQIKSSTQVNIEEYDEFQPKPNVSYASSNLRSPFMRSKIDEIAATAVERPNCDQPNNNRRKQVLEGYGLDGLQMAGVFTNQGRKYALVKANDGSLHKVTQGSYIGLFHGQITQIKNTEILIKEMLPDGGGCYKSKQATLTMSSMVGENNNV